MPRFCGKRLKTRLFSQPFKNINQCHFNMVWITKLLLGPTIDRSLNITCPWRLDSPHSANVGRQPSIDRHAAVAPGLQWRLAPGSAMHALANGDRQTHGHRHQLSCHSHWVGVGLNSTTCVVCGVRAGIWSSITWCWILRVTWRSRTSACAKMDFSARRRRVLSAAHQTTWRQRQVELSWAWFNVPLTHFMIHKLLVQSILRWSTLGDWPGLRICSNSILTCVRSLPTYLAFRCDLKPLLFKASLEDNWT